MGLPWNLILTTIGAAITTLLGVFVGSAVGNRSQRAHWSRGQQAEACAAILRESSNLLIALAALRNTIETPSADGVAQPTTLDWKPWNEALAMTSLVAEHDVYQAALAIDEQFWPVHAQVKRGWVGNDDWYSLRNQIDERRIGFVNVARRRLAPAGPPVQQLTGRPTPDHPMWHFRRDYFQSETRQETATATQPVTTSAHPSESTPDNSNH